jgi:putative transposon-encoded protein
MRKAKTKEIQTEVTESGNAAHVYVPKNWLGRQVKVILLQQQKVEEDTY